MWGKAVTNSALSFGRSILRQTSFALGQFYGRFSEVLARQLICPGRLIFFFDKTWGVVAGCLPRSHSESCYWLLHITASVAAESGLVRAICTVLSPNWLVSVQLLGEPGRGKRSCETLNSFLVRLHRRGTSLALMVLRDRCTVGEFSTRGGVCRRNLLGSFFSTTSIFTSYLTFDLWRRTCGGLRFLRQGLN